METRGDSDVVKENFTTPSTALPFCFRNSSGQNEKNVFADQKKAASPRWPGKSRNPALLWGLCTDPFPRLFPGYPTRSSPCSIRRTHTVPCSEILRQVIGPPSQISNKLKFPMKTSKLRLHQRSESLSRRSSLLLKERRRGSRRGCQRGSRQASVFKKYWPKVFEQTPESEKEETVQQKSKGKNQREKGQGQA